MTVARGREVHYPLYGRNLGGKLIDSVAEKKRSKIAAKATSDGLMKATGINEELRLIPWREIESSVALAGIRGHWGIVSTFFQVLVGQSLFDDQGAWWRPRQYSPRHATGKKAA